MMGGRRFTKLSLGPMTEARHKSVAGSIVIADYIDPLNSQRTLVLEKAPLAAKVPKANKKPKATGAAVNFPAGEVISG